MIIFLLLNIKLDTVKVYPLKQYNKKVINKEFN